MNRTDEFLDLYRTLELEAASQYHLPVDHRTIQSLMTRPEFERFRPELEYCRDVRNLLSHKPRVDGAYAVEPSEAMLETLRRVLRRLQTPETNLQCATRIERALTAAPEDAVLPVMRRMHEQGFSHVPILVDGRVAGVFSENTIFACVLDETIAGLTEVTPFSALERYLPLSARQKRRFAFVPRNGSIYASERMLRESFDRVERLDMLFVTENGRETERVLGLLTPWDVLGQEYN